jgi:hypothetical protein
MYIKSITCDPIRGENFELRVPQAALVIINNGSVKSKVKMTRRENNTATVQFANVFLSPFQILTIKEFHRAAQSQVGYKIDIHENFVITGSMVYDYAKNTFEMVDDGDFRVHERLYLGTSSVVVEEQARPIYTVVCDQRPRLHISHTGDLYDHILNDVEGLNIYGFIQKLYDAHDNKEGSDVFYYSPGDPNKKLIIPKTKGGFSAFVAYQLDVLFPQKLFRL